MYRSLADFLQTWQYESASTQKLMRVLTDASLAQPIWPGGRTLGRLAWHVATSIPEMANRTGLTVGGVEVHAPSPSSAKAIADGYAAASASLVSELTAKWTDASLAIEDDMYGQQWSRSTTLGILISHQSHHRGQMTVLMRQAGLVVPGMYGPAQEEWAMYGMEAPPEA